MNTVNIIGRLARDPEHKQVSTGTTLCSFAVAVDDGFGDKKKTYFIDVNVWGKTADVCAKYLNKGNLVGLTGRITQDKWQDKETGKNRSKVFVTAQTVDFLTPKKDTLDSQVREAGVVVDEVPF